MSIAAIESPRAIETPRRVERWFFINVALFLIVYNIIAFVPSYFDTSMRNVPLPPTTTVTAHAVLGSVFVILFLAQTMLVATGRTDVHRRLGIVSAVVGVALVVLGSFTIIENERRGFRLDCCAGAALNTFTPGSGVATPGLVVPLTFGILLAAALYYRNRPDVHKRLMLFAVLGNLTPVPTGHLIFYWNLGAWAPVLFPLSLVAFLSLVPLSDRTVIGRIHPVSLWVPIGIFLSQQAVFVVVSQTAAWRDFSGWLIR